jgi:hypothetical protein
MSVKRPEIEYLKAADPGRLATVTPDGTPQNSPVTFTYYNELGTIDIVDHHMSRRPVAGALPVDPRHRRGGRNRFGANVTQW